MQKRFNSAGLILIGAFFVLAPLAHAGVLTYVSDLISTSAPGTPASHTIQFTLVQAVPASGTITITPEGAFTIPSGFDWNGISFQTSTGGGSYIPQTLAATPNASADGVTVVTGANPSITFTLNSTFGLATSTAVRVVLASTAPADNPVNPITTGSYRVRIHTKNALNAPLDYGTAMTAIVSQVTASTVIRQISPTRSNGEPTGTVAANNPIIELSLTTDIPSICRYATTTGVAYASMTHTFTSDAAEKVFYTDLTGFVNNTSYAFYVRCISTLGIVNTDDYPITFTLAPTPVTNTSISASGSNGHGGVGNIPNGSSVLYLGGVDLIGSTSPQSTITILKDGASLMSALSDAKGNFDAKINNLERGVYTFSIFATDSKGVKTTSDQETLTVDQGSTNTISNIVLPPSISLATSTVPVGSDVTVSGQTLPNASVEMPLLGASGSTAHSYSATSSPVSGLWSITIPASDLAKGAYQIKARTLKSIDSTSVWSAPLALGIGEAAPAGLGNPDLNGDGKVNLIDFSIFLTMWGTNTARADFNGDGSVSIADFSIMLFHWTG